MIEARGLLAAACLTASVLSGCSVQPSEQAGLGVSPGIEQTVPLAPNRTLSEVSQLIGGDAMVASLPTPEHVGMVLPDGSAVEVYNFTPEKLDAAKVGKMVVYLSRMLPSEKTSWKVDVDDGTGRHLSVRAEATPRKEEEHDVLVVPKDTPLPEDFSFIVNNAGTREYDKKYNKKGVPQAVSIVKTKPNPSAGGQPYPLLEEESLPTELCQNLVDIKIKDAGVQTVTEAANLQLLGQEAVCNSLGLMLSYASQGVGYGTYVQSVEGIQVSLPGLDGKQHLVRYVTASQQEYGLAATQLA